MNKTILFGSLLAVFLMVMVPNVNALEYNEVREFQKIKSEESINKFLNLDKYGIPLLKNIEELLKKEIGFVKYLLLSFIGSILFILTYPVYILLYFITYLTGLVMEFILNNFIPVLPGFIFLFLILLLSFPYTILVFSSAFILQFVAELILIFPSLENLLSNLTDFFIFLIDPLKIIESD